MVLNEMNRTLALLEQQTLGQPSGNIRLNGPGEFSSASSRLAQQARRDLQILSYDLDPRLYDQISFVEAIKQLCLQSRQSQVRILLQNNERVQKHGHRVLELARRLPSRIAIRRPHPDYLHHRENFLLADRTGYIHRPLHSSYHGDVNFMDRLEAERLADFFSQVWGCSEADTDLRRLDI
jgi:hypothetical protein